MLNEEGYSYGINSPMNLQILQLDSHGSQLSGAKKNRTVLSAWFKFYCKGNTKKLLKIQKGPRTVKHTSKNHVFGDISGTGCNILKIRIRIQQAKGFILSTGWVAQSRKKWN
jgi:hypothetical protein